MTDSITIFNSTSASDKNRWRIVDDVVMGGRSDGRLTFTEEGHALFYGRVSLENNGGFSSVRLPVDIKNVSEDSKIRIRLRGDAKRYQFRVKSNWRDRYSYVLTFDTSGEWEFIDIPLSQMKPTFRGMKLRMPDFDSPNLQEIAFLISNKVEENFRLEISEIEFLIAQGG